MKKSKTSPEKKRKNPILNLIKTEWEYLGNRKKIFIYTTILFVIAGAITLTRPLVIGLIFNSVQENISSDQELKKLLFMISLLLVIEIGFWIFHGFGRALEGRTGFNVNRNYTNDKIKKVLNLPMKWHKDHHSGDTIDKINRGSAAISGFAEYTTFQIVYAIMSIVGSITILFFIDIRAALIASGFSIITIFAITRMDKKLDIYYRKINKFGNKASASIYDYVSNIMTVITLRLRKTAQKEIDHKLMASYSTFKRSINLNEIKWGSASIMISLMIVIVLSLRAYTDYNTTGIILVGTLYILYGYLGNVGRTFHNFADLYGRLVTYDSSIVSAHPIDDEYKRLVRTSQEEIPENWKKIKLKNINFTHTKGKNIMHLDNVNLNIERGKKIALVGESGSGKSTILALIRGLNKPESGEIELEGKTIKGGFNKIKNITTLIPQDPEIFNNSIKFNVTMGFPTSIEKINKVLSMAQFKKVLKRLDKGLSTNVLEKGVSLSGGEKQRLALARGILAAENSDLLLMDEPTSSVDSLNEIKIHENIFKEYNDKTIISSIHRLHLLNKFDYIYIFDKGKIVTEGTLNEIKKSPYFKTMWDKYMHSQKE